LENIVSSIAATTLPRLTPTSPIPIVSSVEGYDPHCAGGVNRMPNCPSHGRPCRIVTSSGRQFYECTMPFGQQCALFENEWIDDGYDGGNDGMSTNSGMNVYSQNTSSNPTFVASMTSGATSNTVSNRKCLFDKQDMSQHSTSTSTSSSMQSSWACTACTFINTNGLGLACLMCNTERTSTLKKSNLSCYNGRIRL
jgi:hypothetical protein